MKLFLSSLVLSLAALASGSQVAERKLQSDTCATAGLTALEQRWCMGEPTLSYDAVTGEFTLSYDSGPGSSIFVFQAFDECPNGDFEYNEADLNTFGAYFWLFTVFGTSFDIGVTGGVLSPVDFDVTNFGFATVPDQRDVEWKFTVGNAAFDESSIYSEAGGVGTLNFCARLGLANGIGLPNFRQIDITITYDLANEFAVQDFYTQSYEEVTGGVEGIELTAVSSPCTATEGTTSNPYNQGDEICLNVCGEDNLGIDTDVVSIDSLTLTRTDPALGDGTEGGTLSQSVVAAGTLVAPSSSSVTCDGTCCQVKFLLRQNFFPVDENQTPEVATVSGLGEATVTTLGRRRKLRILSENERAKFTPEFQILETAYPDSSASTIGAVAAAGAMAGAALLL